MRRDDDGREHRLRGNEGVYGEPGVSFSSLTSYFYLLLASGCATYEEAVAARRADGGPEKLCGVKRGREGDALPVGEGGGDGEEGALSDGEGGHLDCMVLED